MANAAYLATDPFPSIPPALLNSADISDYAVATGMLNPFDINKLKSASYEVDFLGEVHSWGKDGPKRLVTIAKGQKFVLQKNSIVFVYLSTIFRLPSYIAIRFNLKITHVHRGLLLGTGPLVDPGFEGRLLIPLHNLTSDDYELEGGKGLIWVEFTKISGNATWGDSPIDVSPKTGTYVPFPEDKKNLSASAYFFKASPHAPIRSSIPFLLETAKAAADRAVKESRASEDFIRRVRRQGYWIGGITIAAVIVALIAVFFQVFSLVSDANNYVVTLRKDMDVTERKVDEQYKLRQKSEETLSQLEKEVRTLRSAMEKSRPSRKSITSGNADSTGQ